MSYKLIATQFLWVTVGRALARGSIVVASMILARSLDIEGFTSFSYFLMTVNLLATYSSMGLGVTTNRYFVEAGKPSPEKSRVLAAIITISVAFSLLGFLVVLAMPAELLTGRLDIPRWIMAWGVLLFSLEAVSQNAMSGRELYRQDAMISIASSALLIAMTGYAAWKKDAEMAMMAMLGVSAVRIILAAIMILRSMGWKTLATGFPFHKSDALKVFNFSLPMFLVSLLASTGPWAVGRIILSGPGGQTAFAFYAIGLQWFSLGMFFPGSVSRISMPRLVRSIDNPRPEDPVKNHVMLGLKLTLSTSLVIAIAGLVLSDFIMTLYGSDYHVSKWFLASFLTIAALGAAVQMMGILIVASGLQWDWFKLNVVFLGVLVLTSLLFREYGIWTGPLAFLLAYLIFLAMTLLVVKRRDLITTT